MLIPNVLFRMGGAGILLTNKESERHRAKYKLRHVVRTHMGANDDAFRFDTTFWIQIHFDASSFMLSHSTLV